MKKKLLNISIIFLTLILLFISGCIFNNKNNTIEEQTIGKIGDTISNSDNISICLESCENTKEVGSELLNEVTENNFIILTLKISNYTNTQQTFYGNCIDLYNSKNVKYEAKTSLYIDYIISEDIGSGIIKSFQVLFETPTTTNEEIYTAKIGYSKYTRDKDRVTFILQERESTNTGENNYDSSTSDNNLNNNLSKFYIENCPITFDKKTSIYSGDLQLVLANSSDKKIIAYEAIYILYDVYGEALKWAWSDSIYNKIAETPSVFTPEHQDIQIITIADKVYSADIYIYYVLFEDQTSWGQRKDITIGNILTLCTCKKVVKN